MVPARTILRRRRYHHYDESCSFDHTQLDRYYRDTFSMTSGYMAEEDARTGGAPGGGDGVGNADDEGEEGDVGTSDSRRYGGGTGEAGGGDEGWLQLGLGTSSSAIRRPDGRQPGGLLELNLFSERPSDCRPGPSTWSLGTISTGAGGAVPLFPTSTSSSSDVSRGTWNVAEATASSSAPFLCPAPQPYGSRLPMYISGGLSLPVMGGSRSAVDVRVVGPPSRPQNGVWFTLQASQSQMREPFLPQIPKCYLRIKDGGMTIRVLMKYLVNKLGLDNESQVEITCRGRQLAPHLTLQHVRDRIWCPREIVAAPMVYPINPVMTLHYGRSMSRLV